jgi:hypothetical protein
MFCPPTNVLSSSGVRALQAKSFLRKYIPRPNETYSIMHPPTTNGCTAAAEKIEVAQVAILDLIQASAFFMIENIFEPIAVSWE